MFQVCRTKFFLKVFRLDVGSSSVELELVDEVTREDMQWGSGRSTLAIGGRVFLFIRLLLYRN